LIPAAADDLAAAFEERATDVALGGVIDPEDEDDKRTAGGGSSSPDGPDEPLRKVWRLALFLGGFEETAVETVGLEGTSPVGVFARGIEEFGGKSNREPHGVSDGELGTDCEP
jgi:hypothetical protein